jgi:hypothetical protein
MTAQNTREELVDFLSNLKDPEPDQQSADYHNSAVELAYTLEAADTLIQAIRSGNCNPVELMRAIQTIENVRSANV